MDDQPAIDRITSALRDRLRLLWRPRLYLLAVLFLLAGGVGVAWGSWQNLCATCPSVARIRTWQPDQTSKLLAQDGRVLVELGHQQRTPISFEDLPDHVPQAVVAVEDKRFFEHAGFDPRGFVRAALGVLTGRNLGGGSTLTQQLARNMFEQEVGFERRYRRKLRELQVAFELERAYSKEQILEAYLNEVYMGRGWGFQSAARGYFGKDITEVDPSEAALLAALLQSPGNLDPVTYPRRAMSRRNLVLSLMADQGYLEPQEVEEWKRQPLPTRDFRTSSLHGAAPYFEEWVRQLLDERFGEQVYRGGLRVFTTLDLDIQESARRAMDWGWGRIEAKPNFRHPPYAEFDTASGFGSPAETPYLQGALVALDPHTGHVKAMIGGRDFEQSKYDRARLAQRQAGSAFKPFVYASAIMSGIPASHIVDDNAVVYPQEGRPEWRPRNFTGQFEGPMTIREALRRSINMVAIKLGWEEVGIETVAQTARRLGIETEIERFPSTTIGAVEVRPIEMAEAYGVFATLGTRIEPFPILRVENADGEVVWEPRPERATVLDSLVARITVDLLQDAANRGTGASHRTLGELPPQVPTAGKTGTTNEGTNTWFVGFTPNLVASVWFGMDRPQPMASGAPQATGSDYAAPVWGRFMRYVYYGFDDSAAAAAARQAAAEAAADTIPPDPTLPDTGRTDTDPQEETWGAAAPPPGFLPLPDPWPVPVGLTTRDVDARSGKLWSEWCDDPEQNRYTEYYIPGTEPTEYCDDSDSRIFRIRP